MAVPVVASVTTALGLNDTYDIVLNKPSGTASGDVLVAFVALNYTESAAWSTPSGWTSEGYVATSYGSSGYWRGRMQMFTRRADGTEGSTFTFSENSMLLKNGVCLRITGVAAGVTDLTHKYDGNEYRGTGAYTHTTPEITTTVSDCLIISAFFEYSHPDENSNSWSGNGGITEQADIDFYYGGESYGGTLAVYTSSKATAGAVSHSADTPADVNASLKIIAAIEAGALSPTINMSGLLMTSAASFLIPSVIKASSGADILVR